jgi:hypothetical protein
MKTFEEHAKEILALAWARLDTPLWKARLDMEAYLRENFVRVEVLGITSKSLEDTKERLDHIEQPSTLRRSSCTPLI